MPAIYLRLATEKDLSTIWALIEKARWSLSKNKIPQWQNGNGPNIAILQTDIQKQQCYVLVVADTVVGTGTISSEPEIAYEQLAVEIWLAVASSYVVIHRVAVDSSILTKL